MKATLTYHSIDESGSPISVSPAVFDAHLRWLASGRVRVLSLDELARHPADAEDAVAVTFDDGFSHTGPLLLRMSELGLPVTVFVVSGHVGRDNAWGGRHEKGIPTLPLLGWDALGRLHAQRVTIGAHTRRHPALTRLPDDQAAEELAGAADDIRQRLGVSPAHVAYPFGAVDDRIATIARRTFAHGYTTDFRVMHEDEDPLHLPRLDMYYFRKPGALELWGTAAFHARVAMCRARRAARATLTRLTARGSV